MKKTTNMNNDLSFGTFNVPVLSNDSLTASFTAPSILPKEMLSKIHFSDQDMKESDMNSFDVLLKAVTSVPKNKVKANVSSRK